MLIITVYFGPYFFDQRTPKGPILTYICENWQSFRTGCPILKRNKIVDYHFKGSPAYKQIEDVYADTVDFFHHKYLLESFLIFCEGNQACDKVAIPQTLTLCCVSD